MADDELANVFVVLCDWRGRVVWSSRDSGPAKTGDVAWTYLTPESQARASEAFAKVASLRQSQSLVVAQQEGKHFRCWLWPLDSPDVAVCGLCREVPSALIQLTERELECLQLLAQGLPTREIAERLDMSTSTLHSHLVKVRGKLDLDNLEALISFAARYCYPPSQPLSPAAER